MSDPAELPGYEFLGWGPRAASGGLGWHLEGNYFSRCGARAGMLRLWNDQSQDCPCGRLHKDVDAGRFGSSDGDDSIAVYRQLT